MIPTDIYGLLLEAAFLLALLATFYAGVRIIEASVKRIQRARMGFYSEIVIAVATMISEAQKKVQAHGEAETDSTIKESDYTKSEYYNNPSTLT